MLHCQMYNKEISLLSIIMIMLHMYADFLNLLAQNSVHLCAPTAKCFRGRPHDPGIMRVHTQCCQL